MALSLFEMLVKNCGITFVRYIDENFCRTWEKLMRKKQSTSYSLGRGFNKMIGKIAPTNVRDKTGAITNETAEQWTLIVEKSLFLLQLI